MPLESPSPRPSLNPEPPRRTWLLYLLLGLFAAILFSRSGPGGDRISYSEFKQHLTAGQVAQVEISKDRLIVTPTKEAAKKRASAGS